VLIVLAPLAIATYYLFARASDQYHSEVSFSVRSEELASATAGLIGALTQVGGGTSDADILYEYIRSQQIVASIDPSLDLRAIWNRAENDPYFTLGDDSTFEALHAQWNRMVGVAYDAGTGIIHIQVRAFRPEDATAIATAILARSDALVNTLSEQARKDAVRFANEELADAEANLRDVRDRVATFRRDYNLVDPQADVAGQMGLLNALQAELAQALVDRDVLTSYAAEGDQRVVQADRRIAAITKRLEDERGSLSVAGVGASLPEVIGRYEELLVDLEFASTAYTQALGGVTAARAEARRQSRYLAAHIQPSAAESSLYPRRAMLAGLTGLFLLLGWGVLALFYYNVRDDR
jgi:capsular polysaccharide transport system permease protein